MSKASGLTHILTELSSLDDLGQFLKRSSRLKYTGISVSRRYLALGSNKGGNYIFSRDTLKYLQVIFVDTESNPVTCLALSPTDQHIGVASSSGFVAVFELNIDKRAKPERVRQSFSHSGHAVTSLAWDTTGTKLFVGDDHGRISVLFVPSNKNKALFALPSEVMADLNDGIFQLSWWQEKLLVSTLTFCHLFDTNKEGEYGACIFLEPNSLCPVIYCARPGSRIWEVDFKGTVLNTHQFKQLLAVPPVSVVNTLHDSYTPSTKIVNKGGLSVSFNKMIHVGHLILTWSSAGLYFFDPINVKVMIWTDSIKGIKDISVFGNDCYIFTEQARITRLTLLPVYQAFLLLTTRAKWGLMADLLLSSDQINVRPAIMKRVKRDLLDNLISGLNEKGDTATIEKIRASMEDISEGSVESLNMADDLMGSTEILGYTQLPSGMIVVNDGLSSTQPHGVHYGVNSEKGEIVGKNYLRLEFGQRCLSPEFLEDQRQRQSPTLSEIHPIASQLDEEMSPDLDHNPMEVENASQKLPSTIHGAAELWERVETELPNVLHSISINEKLNHEQEDRNKHEEFKSILPEKGQSFSHLNNDHILEDKREEDKARETDDIPDSCGQKNNEIMKNGGTGYNTQLFSETQNFLAYSKGTHDLSKDCSPMKFDDISLTNEAQTNDHIPDATCNLQQQSFSSKKHTQTFGSNKNMKGDKESIAEPVKPSKKKKKRKQPGAGLMERSMSLQKLNMKGQMHVSLSCSDLCEKALYVHCDSGESNISINADDTNGEEQEAVAVSPSPSRKTSTGSIDLAFLSEENALPSQLPWKERKEEVIPPLIDRLAAARVSIHTEENATEEDMDLIDSLLSSKVSLLALKDGFSSKLKTQTKSWINKGKTLLVKSASSPHFSTAHDSFRPAREDIMLQEEIIPETDDSEPELSQDIEHRRVLVDFKIPDTLADKIHSLCLKATRINRKLSDPNLVTNPSKMIQLLDDWAKELNQVSYEYHYVRWKKGKERAEAEGPYEKSGSVPDTFVNGNGFRERNQINELTFDLDIDHGPHIPDSDLSLESSFRNGCDDSEPNKDSSGLGKEDHSKLSSNDQPENITVFSSSQQPLASDSVLPVEYLQDMFQVTDPFRLLPEHFEVIQSLTTLCFSCRAMGDIVNVFHQCQPTQQANLIDVIVPGSLRHSFIDNDLPFREFVKEFHATKTDPNSNYFTSSLVGRDDVCEESDCKEDTVVTNCSQSVTRDSIALKDTLVSDLGAAIFVRLHFFALDYDIMKREFDKRQDKISLAWISLVQCCQERGKRDIINSIMADNQVNSAIDYLRSGILLHPSALLGHIHNLFGYAPAKTAEFCAEIHSSIHAADIVRLSWLQSKSASDALLRYGKKIMIDLAPVQRPVAFEKLCEHPVVRYLLLESLLPLVTLKQDETAHGETAKNLATQFLAILPSDWLKLILSKAMSDEEKEVIIELGMKLGNWSLCTKLLASINQRNHMLKLIVQVGQLDLLQDNCLPQSLDEWRIIFKFCLERMKRENNISTSVGNISSSEDEQDKTDSCIKEREEILHTGDVKPSVKNSVSSTTPNNSTCICRQNEAQCLPDATNNSILDQKSFSLPLPQKTISWNDLGRCMLQNVGGVASAELLLEFSKELDENAETLDPALLNACFTDFRILMEQDHLCHEALQRMSVYMWTQQPSYLPPSVHHAIKSEALCKVNGDDDMNLQSVFNRLLKTSSTDFVEEQMGNHWGFDIDLDKNCPTCNISLGVSMSLDMSGVVIFPCGHIFHKSCVCNDTCPFLH